MRDYCTYFDANYTVKGLALYRSLAAQRVPFTLWVLAFDSVTRDVLNSLDLDDLRVISLEEFEADDPELVAAKQNRSRVEYFFTSTPSLPLYILRQNPELRTITYLDSDLYCFSDPEPLFDALGENSILITPHRFPHHLKDREQYGIYNVGVLTFRNDPHGLECLHWWRERCLEWCYDRLEGDRFADQGYLNDWPTMFQRVVAIEHKGVNTAPWNWMTSRISRLDKQVLIDDDPLIFFHFHQLRQFNNWLCDPGTSSYASMSSNLRKFVYAPYIQELKATWEWLHIRVPNATPGYTRLATARDRRSKLLKDVVRSAVRGQLMLSPGRRVI